MIINQTPLYKDHNLSSLLGSNIYVKRDDLFDITGGGNKGRKSQYILSKCLSLGCNAVVTCGGLHSNHTRATALKCKELGIECTIVIHDSDPGIKKAYGNYQILKLLGVKIVFCEMKNVSQTMDEEMDTFRKHGLNPFYIWGGGHCIEGSLAYYECVDEIYSQVDTKFDFVFHASGTGTTQAGLHCGFKKHSPGTKVIGISVARNKARGSEEVFKSIVDLENELSLAKTDISEVCFDDSYTCGGYEESSNELIECISSIASCSGLILDPTYTGKAFIGMMNYIKDNNISNNHNILFLHTGGLLNLMGSHKI